MVDTPLNGNGNGRRFQATVSLGNVLTIIGGIFIGGAMLVTITRAFDDLDKKISLLAKDVRSIERVLHLPAGDGL